MKPYRDAPAPASAPLKIEPTMFRLFRDSAKGLFWLAVGILWSLGVIQSCASDMTRRDSLILYGVALVFGVLAVVGGVYILALAFREARLLASARRRLVLDDSRLMFAPDWAEHTLAREETERVHYQWIELRSIRGWCEDPLTIAWTPPGGRPKLVLTKLKNREGLDAEELTARLRERLRPSIPLEALHRKLRRAYTTRRARREAEDVVRRVQGSVRIRLADPSETSIVEGMSDDESGGALAQDSVAIARSTRPLGSDRKKK